MELLWPSIKAASTKTRSGREDPKLAREEKDATGSKWILVGSPSSTDHNTNRLVVAATQGTFDISRALLKAYNQYINLSVQHKLQP